MNWFAGFLGNKREALLQLALIVGILVNLNVLSTQGVWRFDWTADNRYTLSDASRTIARGLEDPVTVTAYFSDDLPPRFGRAEEQFRHLLEEFRAYAGGNLEYEFVNPNESDEAEQQAQQAGIRPVMIDVRERDQVTQQRAYLGAVFQYGEQREVVPLIQPGAALEYTVASTVKQLTAENKPQVGLLQGHGEPSQQALPQLMQELRKRYTVTNVTGIDTAGVPPETEVLLVVAPEQSLSQDELIAIDQYIMRGGRAVFALNRVRTNLRFGAGRALDTGLETLLDGYNLPVNLDLVRDRNASAVQVSRQQGMFNVVNQIRYPYIPQVVNFADHPITSGLETVMMQFVSSLDTAQVDSTQSLTVLARSSAQSGRAQGPTFNLDPMQEWSTVGFGASHLPVAALIEGPFTSAFADVDSVAVERTQGQEAALVVMGDGDFIVNGQGQQQQRLPEDNVNLVLNSIDYLADDTGLIALRTKGITNRPLKMVEAGTKTLLKYLNVFLPIVLVVGYGVVRYQRRQARRRRWKQMEVPA